MALVNKQLSDLTNKLSTLSNTDRIHIIHYNSGTGKYDSYYTDFETLKSAILDNSIFTLFTPDITLTSGVEYSYSDATYNQLILAVIFEPTSGTLKIYDGVNTYKEDNSDINSSLNLYLPKAFNLKFLYTGSGTETCKLIIFKWA